MQLKCVRIWLVIKISQHRELKCIACLETISAILLTGLYIQFIFVLFEHFKSTQNLVSSSHFIRLDFGDSYNPNPVLIKGNGDGTVNRRSLIGCGYWENTAAQGNHKIYQQEFPGVEHYNMLSNSGPINYIINKLTGLSDFPNAKEIANTTNVMKFRLFWNVELNLNQK